MGVGWGGERNGNAIAEMRLISLGKIWPELQKAGRAKESTTCHEHKGLQELDIGIALHTSGPCKEESESF